MNDSALVRRHHNPFTLSREPPGAGFLCDLSSLWRTDPQPVARRSATCRRDAPASIFAGIKPGRDDRAVELTGRCLREQVGTTFSTVLRRYKFQSGGEMTRFLTDYCAAVCAAVFSFPISSFKYIYRLSRTRYRLFFLTFRHISMKCWATGSEVHAAQVSYYQINSVGLLQGRILEITRKTCQFSVVGQFNRYSESENFYFWIIMIIF